MTSLRLPSRSKMLSGHDRTMGPESVEVTARSVTVGGDHVTTVAVTGYPTEVGGAWLEPLLAYPGRIDVSVHIEPISTAVAATRLKNSFQNDWCV